MPRGKRTVFTVLCSVTGMRLGTVRLHKQDKKGKGFKDHAAKWRKYCPKLKKRVEVKLKEERHSS